MSILLTYGTRPELIKIKPLMAEMVRQNIPFKTLFTGQHKDLNHISDYELKQFRYGGNRLDDILHNCLDTPKEALQGVTHILVQGDTTSVMGLSLMAMHRKVKIIHLEAGLRSFDFENPYPEEYNRTIVSRLANIHLCPTAQNKLNLLNEGIDPYSIYVVGNTGLDNLLPYKDKLEYTNKILVTLHRRENFDILDDWFNVISQIADKYTDYEFILPVHPNPAIREKLPKNTKINIIEPLPHEDLLNLLTKCSLVITDSGGIQEECSFLNKKCLVCRKTTERPEAVGYSSFIVEKPIFLFDIFEEQIKNPVINHSSPFGDGTSSIKICNVIKNAIR